MAGLKQLNWASEGVGATAAALVDLSTVAGNKISNPPWVKFQSAGWVNFPSAPTQVELPPPAHGEVRIRHAAIGVNFVDIYHRTGLYALPALPAVLGVEAAGVVEAVGSGVESLLPGQRVAYAGLPVGGYSSARNLPADQVLPIPDDLEDDTVASLLLRGVTTHMLYSYVYQLKAGNVVLVHAAAGGLGLVLVWCFASNTHILV